MAEGQSSNGRMTWREVHELMEKRDEKLIARLDNIESKLEPLPALCQRISRNEKDITENKEEIKAITRRSNWLDGVNAAIAMIGATIAALFGKAP